MLPGVRTLTVFDCSRSPSQLRLTSGIITLIWSSFVTSRSDHVSLLKAERSFAIRNGSILQPLGASNTPGLRARTRGDRPGRIDSGHRARRRTRVTGVPRGTLGLSSKDINVL